MVNLGATDSQVNAPPPMLHTHPPTHTYPPTEVRPSAHSRACRITLVLVGSSTTRPSTPRDARALPPLRGPPKRRTTWMTSVRPPAPPAILPSLSNSLTLGPVSSRLHRRDHPQAHRSRPAPVLHGRHHDRVRPLPRPHLHRTHQLRRHQDQRRDPVPRQVPPRNSHLARWASLSPRGPHHSLCHLRSVTSGCCVVSLTFASPFASQQ